MDAYKVCHHTSHPGPLVEGDFVDHADERYYVIRQVDRIPPFLVSVVSSDDHWLFASSTGGLTAGRVSPGNALFPYITVDKVHESAAHTGSRTLLRIHGGSAGSCWEPFNREHFDRFEVTRNLYKNILGNKLCFEEVNHDLRLAFRYTWMTSREHGFIRRCELENLGPYNLDIDLLDGLQNLLPAGTELYTQTNVSNLVDAYKWTELYPDSGLAVTTLYSAITDRAHPAESLKATTVFCLGLEAPVLLLSTTQVDAFRAGSALQQEHHRRGIRGAYLASTTISLAPGSVYRWQIIANTRQSQKDVVALQHALRDPARLAAALDRAVDEGSDKLARIVAGGDGLQSTSEENVSVHHYANVLFNTMRGGTFFNQYTVLAQDFISVISGFNKAVHTRNRALLERLPGQLGFGELLQAMADSGDRQLLRLTREYLPLTFGRRHGDPSRPWNAFTIQLKDAQGNDLLSYEGNWRDIFQNWEALAFSFPELVENMIAKFVNASTIDGYNPYRITKEGIDWEVEEPDNPWSYIGYWGDHQIIYLQKLLEISEHFHPATLRDLLQAPLFSYANVPYRIKPFKALLADPKHTVVYAGDLAERIEQRVAAMGFDGKLVLDARGEVCQVTLLEKLLVPLLAKLGNLVPGGGIWLNTQRPEWNDANNALVGHGLSVVTLCHLYRYVRQLSRLLEHEAGSVVLSTEVSRWVAATAAALQRLRHHAEAGSLDHGQRFQLMAALGEAASAYREDVYQREGFSGTCDHPAAGIRAMLDDALAVLEHSIAGNRRDDGLYHTYNLMDLRRDSVRTEALYPMLEGQVAALSSGAITPAEAVGILEALYQSDMYREDQDSFMLYPDRRLPAFLEKNRISATQVQALPLLLQMLDAGDERIVLRDADGCYRFNADFRNVEDLKERLALLAPEYGQALVASQQALEQLYESVFNHKAFTGRSGTMFGFEGLGSIYWHMVAKLLLAVQELFFIATDQGTDAAARRRLGELYYRVRAGLGFNKSPAEYGAFPTDPYSHSPRHAGARQPGMTGQVKEEIISRFGELGVRVRQGAVRFEPALLRAREFHTREHSFRHLATDGSWQQMALPAGTLAFTWCQLPIVYNLGDEPEASVTITYADGRSRRQQQAALTREDSAHAFRRSGIISRLDVTFPRSALFADPAEP